MRLDDWLKEVEACPDEYLGETTESHRLTAEFGIQDNWPILVQADLNTIVEKILSEKKWIKITEEKHSWNYREGTVEVEIFRGEDEVKRWIPGIKNQLLDRNKDAEKHWQRIQQYNNVIAFFPYQHSYWALDKSKAKDFLVETDWQKGMAVVISEVADSLRKLKIPFCMPESIGLKYEHDLSKIVYWPDGDEPSPSGRDEEIER